MQCKKKMDTPRKKNWGKIKKIGNLGHEEENAL